MSSDMTVTAYNQTTSATTVATAITPPFSPEMFKLIQVVVGIGVIGSIAAFGLVSNVINLVMFYRQGIMSHSCVVSMAGMALVDLLYCLFNVWGCVCLLMMLFLERTYAIRDTHHIQALEWEALYMISSIRQTIMLSDITAFVTAFVSFERLYSVFFPFTVRTVFTAKRSCVAIGVISAATTVLFIPNNAEFKLVAQKDPFLNITRVVSVSFKMGIDRVTFEFLLYDLFVKIHLITRSFAFVFVVMSNIAITVKVYLSKEMRKSMTSSGAVYNEESSPTPTENINIKKNDRNHHGRRGNFWKGQRKAKVDGRSQSGYSVSKEMRLLRMMMVVCSVFSLCYLTDFGQFLYVYAIKSPYKDIHYYVDFVTGCVTNVFQTVNASCNIFIYYVMSTRFKKEMQLCFCSGKHQSN